MKKIMLVFFISLFSISLMSCGSKTSTATTATGSGSTFTLKGSN